MQLGDVKNTFADINQSKNILDLILIQILIKG